MIRHIFNAGIVFFFTLLLLFYLPFSALKYVAIGVSVIFAVCALVPAIRKIRGTMFLSLVAFVACILYFFAMQTNYIPALSLQNDNCSIKGQCVALPTSQNGRYYYELGEVEIDGKAVKQHVLLSGDYYELEPGDFISAKEASVYLLGNGSDYYRSEGIYLGSYLTKGIQISKVNDYKDWHLFFQRMQVKVKEHIMQLIPNRSGAIAVAMLLGDKSGFTPADSALFSKLGVSHMFAVSGLHMSLLVAAAYWVSGEIGLLMRTRALTTSIFVFFYMALTGFSVSCVRAGVMFLILLIGRIFKKDTDPFTSMGVAIFVILCPNPLGIGNVGFQLSVLATWGILELYRYVQDWLEVSAKRAIRILFIRRFVKRVLSGVSVTICATVFTLPISLFQFGYLSLWTPISNLLILPFTSLAFLTSGLAALTYGLPYLPYLFSTIAKAIIDIICAIARVLDYLPVFMLHNQGVFDVIAITLAILIAVFYILQIKKYKKQKLHPYSKKICALVVCFAFLLPHLTGFFLHREDFYFYVPNGGKSNCVVVEYKGHAAVFGCEGNYGIASELRDILNKKGIFKIDLLLVSSMSRTEQKQLVQLIDRMPVDKILFGYSESDLTSYSLLSDIQTMGQADMLLWDALKVTYRQEPVHGVCFEIRDQRILYLLEPCENDLPESWQNVNYIIGQYDYVKSLNVRPDNHMIITGMTQEDKKYCDAVDVNSFGTLKIKLSSQGKMLMRRKSDWL